jgi:hypothetical protein
MAPLPDAALLLDEALAGIGQPFHAPEIGFRFATFNGQAMSYGARFPRAASADR